MSNSTTPSKTPAYRIFAVTQAPQGSENKSAWAEIGAAWLHKDGRGLNLKFTAAVPAGADIVLRVPSAKKGAAQ